MPSSIPPAYLAVDAFLETELAARALAFALGRGAIDRLAVAGPMPADDAFADLGLTPAGSRLLEDMLRGNGVVGGDGVVDLAPGFRAVLPFRDLLDAKIAFASLVAADLARHLPAFLSDLPAFMGRAETFALFRYDRCFAVNPENVAAARRWVGYTTALTRHEAGPLLDAIDVSGHRRMLDIGGNSGEFARQACRREPGLVATVLDLPVVCAIGRDHLSGSDEATRVRFRPGDMRRDAVPTARAVPALDAAQAAGATEQGHDLVTFKSVLHDWPDGEARDILARAAAALVPGGRLLVAERAPFRLLGAPTFAMLPNIVFLPFLRPPDLYREVMERCGLVDVSVETVALETPFQLVSARKP